MRFKELPKTGKLYSVNYKVICNLCLKYSRNIHILVENLLKTLNKLSNIYQLNKKASLNERYCVV